MKRDEWEFEYTAKVIADAAVAKKAVHIAKFKWWEDKKEAVLKQIKATGISVRESVAASYSNTKGIFGPQIEVDAGMQRDLTECQNKITEHNGLVQIYDGWIKVLSASPESRLKLDHEDWLFFFGTNTDAKEEQ
jgi:hypothetical protein